MLMKRTLTNTHLLSNPNEFDLQAARWRASAVVYNKNVWNLLWQKPIIEFKMCIVLYS